MFIKAIIIIITIIIIIIIIIIYMYVSELNSILSLKVVVFVIIKKFTECFSEVITETLTDPSEHARFCFEISGVLISRAILDSAEQHICSYRENR